MSCFRTGVSGSPRRLVDLLLIKQVIRPKCSLKSEEVYQEFSLNVLFCKTTQVSQESKLHLMEHICSLFHFNQNFFELVRFQNKLIFVK